MGLINYYTSGITANGYVSYLQNNLDNINKVLYVTGEANYTPLNKYILQFWDKPDYNLEYVHNPFMNFPYESFINKTTKEAVVFNINPGFLPHYIDDKTQVLNLDKYKDERLYKKYQNELLELYQNRQACLQSAFLFFARGLRIHDEWEKIYIGNLNFDKMEALAAQMCQKMFGNGIAEKDASIYDRFLGAATPEGAKDFIQDITKNIKKRYFIKGRPGSGKSTMMKKIAKFGINCGYDIEMYHCGFDSNSMDMIIAPELSVCIFDSTAPHEHFPDRAEDEIVDIYALAINSNTDEKYRAELSEITARYGCNISIATAYLNTMHKIDRQLKEIYNVFSSIDAEEVFNNYISD